MSYGGPLGPEYKRGLWDEHCRRMGYASAQARLEEEEGRKRETVSMMTPEELKYIRE